jgi:outer membrane protein assembly factor BamD (BamD/ComL family)
LISIDREYGHKRLVSAVPMLEELLRLNPQTAYGPAILSSLRNTCAYYLPTSTRDDKKAVEYAKRLVESYPNCSQVDNALYDIECLLPANEAIAYFSQIEATKADTRATRVAKVARIRTRNEAANPSRWKLTE